MSVAWLSSTESCVQFLRCESRRTVSILWAMPASAQSITSDYNTSLVKRRKIFRILLCQFTFSPRPVGSSHILQLHCCLILYLSFYFPGLYLLYFQLLNSRRQLETLAEREVAIIFRQTAANFRKRRLWVLRISILPLNFPEIGDFQPKSSIFGRKFSDNFPTVQNFQGVNCPLISPFATTLRHINMAAMFLQEI